MKLVFVADLHLNINVFSNVFDKEHSSIPFRQMDFMRSFQYIIDRTLELKPDVFVIGGDIYDSHSPSNFVRGFFSDQLSRVIDCNIPIIILIGNHDITQKTNALKDLYSLKLKKVKIIEEPKILKSDKFRFLCFPYSIDVEQKKMTKKAEFHKFVQKVNETREMDVEDIFFGHMGIFGARMNQYHEEEMVVNDLEDTTTTTTVIDVTKEYKNSNKDDISIEELDELGAKYVFLGDFHGHQILKTKKCIAMYSGAIERTTVSDRSEDKGFIVYDTDNEEVAGMGKARFIKIPSRPMLNFVGNIDIMRKQFNEIDVSKFQNAIIKLAFDGNSTEQIDFVSGLESFKKDIDSKVHPVYVYHTSKVKDKDVFDKAMKIEDEILDKGFANKDDVLTVVKEMVKERVSDVSECENIIKLAEEIFVEANGEK